MPTTVFVIDDSAVVRTVLTEALGRAGLQVLGSAADPLFAWDKMQQRWPDVIVLDVEMPRMDGITFLHKLMAERPTPVVMCSTLTLKGAQTTMQALACGAVGFVTKPTQGLKEFLQDGGNGLVDAVRGAARANLRALPRAAAAAAAAAASGGAVARGAAPAALGTARVPGGGVGAGVGAGAGASGGVGTSAGAMLRTTDRVVAIGSSTGGVQSIEVVLRGLDRTCPGIVMVQHMPERFTASLAERLNSIMDVEVAEARDGQRVIDGRVLIAPGGRHLRLQRSGAQYVVEVVDGPLINHHKPSVDVLFRSVAQCAGANALGIVMTGMGDDGARGLREMRDAGAITAAQDEASCVVFGMPAEAIRLGGARDVVGLHDIAGWIRRQATPRG